MTSRRSTCSDVGRLKLCRVKCVALVDVPRLEPRHEPAGALLRGAVGEGVGHHVALGLPLQPVVADGRGSLHRCLHVARFDEVPRFLRVMRPHAGKAIGLQLDPHLDLVGLDFVETLLHLLHLGQDAQQVLHVMANLMGDHVGLRELAGLAAGVAGAEAPLEILKERGVEINLAVVRAVERAHRGLRETASRARGAGEHHERGRLVGLAVLREDLLPLRLRAPEHRRNELSHLIRGRSGLGAVTRGRRRLLLRSPSARQDLGAADQHARIDAQPIADKAKHDDGANPEAASTSWDAKACTLAPPILNVVAARQFIETHFPSSYARTSAARSCATAFTRLKELPPLDEGSSSDPSSATLHRVCWLAIMLFTSPAMIVRIAPPAPPPTICPAMAPRSRLPLAAALAIAGMRACRI